MALMPARVTRMEFRRDPRDVFVEKIEQHAAEFGLVVDSAEEGFDRLQPLARKMGLRVSGPDVLMAIFDRSGQYTSGKVLVPETYIEDRAQGKVGLIIALGPLCRGPDFEEWFGGPTLVPQIGQWWTASIRDGFSYLFGPGIVIRELEWKHVRMHVERPDLVM